MTKEAETLTDLVAERVGDGREMTYRAFQAKAIDEKSGYQPSVDVLWKVGTGKNFKLVPELSDDQLKALIKACAGKDFWERRDEAIIRLMIETGARIGEVVAMTTDDIDLTAGVAIVRRGKGGKGRTIPVGPHTCRALDRYLRLRRAHRLAAGPDLWLGDRGKTIGYSGLYDSLVRRARLAGIEDFHPHVLRHTAAGRWLQRGGSEGGLMAVAGWSRRDMIDRYTKATAQKRAADEARGLNLGDI